MTQSDASSQQRIGVVAETYARALFDLAVKAGEIESTEAELNELSALLDKSPALVQLFANRSLDRVRRAESIHRIFDGRCSELLLRFLGVLNDRNRLDELRHIAAAFAQLAKQHRGEVDADLYTAGALSSDRLNAVADRLSASIGKKVLLHPHVDPELIGGLKVRFGDKLIDASVATQLRRLATRLTDRGHELARSGAEAVLTD